MPTWEDIAMCDLKILPGPPDLSGSRVRRFWGAFMKSVNLFAYGNVLDTFKRCLTAAQLRLIDDESMVADVLVHPFFCESKWYDFENSHRYVQAGREAMQAALPRIRALMAPTLTPMTHHENIPVISSVGCGIT